MDYGWASVPGRVPVPGVRPVLSKRRTDWMLGITDGKGNVWRSSSTYSPVLSLFRCKPPYHPHTSSSSSKNAGEKTSVRHRPCFSTKVTNLVLMLYLEIIKLNIKPIAVALVPLSGNAIQIVDSRLKRREDRALNEEQSSIGKGMDLLQEQRKGGPSPTAPSPTVPKGSSGVGARLLDGWTWWM